MQVRVTIDIRSPEGRQIMEELKQFPDIVTFESDLPGVAEPIKTYGTGILSGTDPSIAKEYIESEVFWELIESKRKKFCSDHGIV